MIVRAERGRGVTSLLSCELLVMHQGIDMGRGHVGVLREVVGRVEQRSADGAETVIE